MRRRERSRPAVVLRNLQVCCRRERRGDDGAVAVCGRRVGAGDDGLCVVVLVLVLDLAMIVRG